MLPSAEVLFPVHALSHAVTPRPQERPCSRRVWGHWGCSSVTLGTLVTLVTLRTGSRAVLGEATARADPPRSSQELL